VQLGDVKHNAVILKETWERGMYTYGIISYHLMQNTVYLISLVGEVRENLEGQFTRGVENTNMTDCISNL
jgi:hypothetical protein